MTGTAIPAYGTNPFKEWFNANTDNVRFVALMSPTCGFCVTGHQAFSTLMSWLDGAPIVGARVWSPWFPADDEAAARKTAATYTDPRVVDHWDPERKLGILAQERLRLLAPAWDTYLVFDRGVTWDEGPMPAPGEWQHQLWPSWGAPQDRLLRPGHLFWELVERVGWDRAEYAEFGDAFVKRLAGDPDPASVRIE